MQQYDHGGDIYGPNPPVLDFSVSLNPVGPPRKVLEAAREAVLDWDRYPDPRCRGLRRAAALRHGVPEEHILFGGGASDLIDRFLVAGQPGHALVLAPTFSEYRRVLERLGCQIQEHALLQEKGFAATHRLLDAIERGWILKADTLEELAEKIKADPENRDMITAEQLRQSVETFNAYCDAGEDKDFNRNMDKLLYELSVLETEASMAASVGLKMRPVSRRARFRSVVTLILDGEKHIFEGTLEGTIARAKAGNGGFGYDPVFIPDEFPDRTLAEITEEQKNAISHRGKALRAMAEYLNSLKQ